MTTVAFIAILISKIFEKVGEYAHINIPLLINLGSIGLSLIIPWKPYISQFYFNYYIELVIAILCVGSIFSLSKDVLKENLPKFLPCIMGAIIGACVFSLGNIYTVALPVVGGGIGMGAVPLSQILSPVLNKPKDELLAYFIIVVTISNLMAILISSIKFPQMSGKSLCANDTKNNNTEFSCEAVLVVCGYMLMAKFVSTLLPIFHHYAWLVIILTISRFTYCPCEDKCVGLYNFYVKHLAYPTLAIVGLCATLTSLPSIYVVFIIFLSIVGSMLGAGLVGRALGLNPIDTGISAGLCMANMGGSGDIAVLITSNRIHLMPFATISSRIGSAIVLVVAGTL